MAKVTWDKLVEFNDNQPVTDAIKMIELLETTYKKFTDSVVRSNETLSTEMIQVRKETESLYASVNKLTGSFQKNEDAVIEAAKTSESLVKQDEALRQTEAGNIKVIEHLKSEIAALTAAKEKLKKATDGEAGSITDLEKKLNDATKAAKNMGTATDQTVKDTQIKKVAELSKQVKDARGALDEAKKGAIVAAGSYNELSSRVAAAKKELKSMEGGLKSNSQEFINLKKYVKEGSNQLKDWDEAVGDNQRKVGDYKNQIAALIPGFGGAAGAIDTATAAGKSFMSSGFGLVIGAVALALASLISYFTGSIEGQDKWNKVLAFGSAILEIFKDGLESVGEFLVHMWEAPMDVLNGFIDFIKDQFINRFMAIFKAAEAFQKLWTSGFKDGWKDLGNAMLQSMTGVTNVIDKVAAKTAELTEELLRRLDIAERLAKLENKIRKEKIKDVVDDANTELQINELLEKSKDKLTFRDEQRLKKVRDARKLLNAQVEGDLELAQLEIDAQRLRIEQAGGLLQANKRLSDLTTDEITAIGVKYEMIETLAQLEAAQTKVQADASTKRKAMLKQEIALIQEISKEYFDQIKRQKDAQKDLDDTILTSIIKRNQDILDEEDSSIGERILAIEESTTAQLAILQAAQDKELDDAKQAAIDKVELNSDTLQKIYNDTTLSLEEQIQAERDAKELALQTDEEFYDEKEILLKRQDKINADYLQKVDDTNKKSLDLVEKNVFTVLERDAKNLSNIISTETADQLTELNTAYQNGVLSIHQYEVAKQKIVFDSSREQLNAQIDNLEEVLNQEGLSNQKRIELEKQLAEARKHLSDQSTSYQIDNQKKMNQAVGQLQVEAFDFAGSLVSKAAEENIAAIQAELELETEKKDARLKIVGDDAQARAAIEESFAAKQREIQNQIAAQKRRIAIFDKARNAAQIVIDTSRAVVQTLPNIPLSLIIGSIGALNLAKVLSTPIPAFWKGTDNAPGGLALVGDRFGRELGIDPSGKVTLYDKPQVANLEKGTKIIPNYKTEMLLADAEKYGDRYLFEQDGINMDQSRQLLAARESLDMTRVIHAINEGSVNTVEAIRSMPQDVIDEEGHRRYETSISGRVLRLNKRYKLQ